MKKYFHQIAAMCSSLVLFVAITANGSRSYIIYHQPKIPAGLEKFKEKRNNCKCTK